MTRREDPLPLVLGVLLIFLWFAGVAGAVEPQTNPNVDQALRTNPAVIPSVVRATWRSILSVPEKTETDAANVTRDAFGSDTRLISAAMDASQNALASSAYSYGSDTRTIQAAGDFTRDGWASGCVRLSGGNAITGNQAITGDASASGDIVTDGNFAAHDMCFFKARQSAANDFPNSTITNATFTAEDYDYGGNFDGVGTFTAPVTGLYQFWAQVYWAGDADGVRSIFFYIDNALPATRPGGFGFGNASAFYYTASTMLKLTANQKVEVRFQQTSGDKLEATADLTWFAGALIREIR